MRRPATYAELEALPEHLVGEIIDDELIVSPRPAPRHTNATSVLGVLLGGPFQLGRGGPGGWWIEDEPELHLGRLVLVPDLAGWRRARMPELPAAAWFDVAPDWICEALSPSTERLDRGRKLRHYARSQVRHAWLLNVTARTLEVLRLHEGRWVLLDVFEGDQVMRAEPFEAIEIALTDLWGPEPTPAAPTDP